MLRQYIEVLKTEAYLLYKTPAPMRKLSGKGVNKGTEGCSALPKLSETAYFLQFIEAVSCKCRYILSRKGAAFKP